jgi:nucleoside-diphosphate-sugar epimerase
MACRSGRAGASVSARRGAVRVEAAASMNVLIVNCKGGGHAFIGLHLAKALMAQGHKVTIMNDGDEAKLSAKGCFAQYGSLAKEGATIMWGSPTDPAGYPTGPFDVVYDNNGKDIDTCKPLIDHFKGKVKHYVFVSSAGMYKANPVEPVLFEGDTRSEKGHFFVEEYLKEHKMPFTIFRPLYIYGEYGVKDYQQWFMERILRDRPVYLPKNGMQLTSMSNVIDVAGLLATVPGNAAAIGQDFNLSNGRCISFEGIVKSIADAAGKEAKIIYYDPKKVDLAKGEGVPFRNQHFFAADNKARLVLGFQPKHTFRGDVKTLLDDFVKAGRLDKDADFSVDDKIAASL